MKRDPFYQQIIECLRGELDSEIFERCAQDVLRSSYPSLVPVRGGTDAGMDGAIADGEGNAFPLVCTTEEDVIGNLTKSLNSYKANGSGRRKVVLATSRALTPKRRQNLEKRAQENDFSLINIHDQASMAELLYHSPEWCVELLGLSGKPPALSSLPRSNRPMITDELIGRQDDLEWLNKTQGDRLLIGQPGIGKTFLLYDYAQRRNGLFVICDDLGEIAAELRRQQPTVIILDDAHVHQALLNGLIHIRKQVSASFAILTSSWPGEDEGVRECMGIPSRSVHELERQSRSEILKIINNAGIGGPEALLNEILNQAEGRAGLAVTLCHLCINGDLWDVVKGDALLKSIRSSFKSLVGLRAFDMLAHFAVGGDMGIAMADVAKVLGLPEIDVRQEMALLAAGGVLTTNQDRLSVRPRALRHVLVRDVFFGPNTPLNIHPILNIAQSIEEVARTLVGAKYAGGKIPQELMIITLEKANSDRAWEEYASNGTDEARFVLTRHPEIAAKSAHTFLARAPENTIPILLQDAVGDKRELHSHPSHPLRKLGDWINDAYPGTSDVISRRKILLGAASQWLRAGSDTDVGLHAIALALSPSFERHSLSPGDMRTITLTFGPLNTGEMKEIVKQWKAAYQVISHLSHNIDWDHLIRLIEKWSYPSHGGKEDDQQQRTRHRCARIILGDIVKLVHSHQGYLHRLKSLAHTIRYKKPIPLEAEFEILFPAEPRDINWRATMNKRHKATTELADRWTHQTPSRVAKLIARYETQAQTANITNWPRLTAVATEKISLKSTRPTMWLDALLKAQVSPLLIEPFFRRIIMERKGRWRDFLERCLTDPIYQYMAMVSAIQADPVLPDEILDKIMPLFDGKSNILFRSELPLSTMQRLLKHSNPDVAIAAAIAEWEKDSTPKVRPEIYNDWRHAIVNYRHCSFANHRHDSYTHREILEHDPDLGLGWLKGLRADQENCCELSETINVVTAKLNAKQRREVLDLLQPKTILARYVLKGILTDNQLYREFLSNPKWKREHLLPLEGFPSKEWADKAILALDAEYSPWDVARAAYLGGDSWRGNESDRLMEWIQAFHSFMTHPDERLNKVASEGIKMAESRRNDAIKQEKYEEIYGEL